LLPTRLHVSALCSFFSSTPHPPPPHSFPTRRSSDLLTAITAAGMSAALVLAGCDASATGTDGPIVLGGVFSKSPVPFGNDAEETDRKSTRLNSSHVSISYAVFCLKQKTNGHEKQNDE